MLANIVGVIVLNWNNFADTIECVESVLRSSYPHFRVIFVDNCSDDDSIKQLRTWASTYSSSKACSGNGSVVLLEYSAEQAEHGGSQELESQFLKNGELIVLIKSDCNRGYAGGNNLGIRYCLAHGGFNYVWILNNDTEVHPDSLTRLVERAEEDESIGICGSTLLYYHDRTRVQALGGARYNKWLGVAKHIGEGEVWEQIRGTIDRDAVERQMDYVVGASMLVSRKFIETVGLMCEEYFLYYEELDWAIRGKKHGFRLAWAPDSIVYHKEGATTGGGADPCKRSLQSDYWSIRNRIYFTRKYYPYALPTVYLGLCGAIVNRIRRRQLKHAAMTGGLMLRGGETRPIKGLGDLRVKKL